MKRETLTGDSMRMATRLQRNEPQAWAATIGAIEAARGDVPRAALLLEVNPRTIRRWIGAYPKLQAVVAKARRRSAKFAWRL